MEHQTLRTSQSQENINCNISEHKDYLQQFYYTMPGQPLPNPALLGVRLAPLAKFDEKDFDLPTPPYEAKHKVKLFKALLIFFSTVIMVSKLADYLRNHRLRRCLPRPSGVGGARQLEFFLRLSRLYGPYVLKVKIHKERKELKVFAQTDKQIAPPETKLESQCPFGTLDFCSHQTATNTPFEWFRCEIKGATENGNFFS